MQKQQAFDFVEQHREDMLALWELLVNHDSGSDDKAGIDALQEKLKKILEAEGGKVHLVEYKQAGNMLVAEFGEARNAAPVIFVGHIDTVFTTGTSKKRPFTIKDGKAYGPGVLDMKGGVVTLLYALKALNAANFSERPIKVLLAGDEENGHLKSTAAEDLVKEATGAIAALNGETGFIDDAIVVGRKGVAGFTLETFGVAAHVGNEPEKGRSAIVEIAHKLLEIEQLTDWEKCISVNVGVIEGGTVQNATPDYAKIKIDVRFTAEKDVENLHQQLQVIAEKTYVEGTTTTVTPGVCFKPMYTTEEVKTLFSLVKETAEENGLGSLYQKKVGGGSDSAYMIMAGVPTVCAMGVKGGRNHSAEEYAIVDTLFERTKLLAATVLKLKEFNMK